jgi:hypothetical protein
MPGGVRVLVAGLLLAAAYPAAAHVNYIDLNAAPGGVGGAAFSNYGWWNGTTPTLGDSHALAGGDFFRFHLGETSLVTITFSDASGTGLLNPAFSVYAGLLPDEAHDDTTTDPLNPKQLVFSPPPPHAVKLASPVDNGVTADAAGRISPFRDTANVEYVGQFDALHGWSMANSSGTWSVVQYVTHVGPGGGSSVSLMDYLLAPGDYTIAAAGGTAGGSLTLLDGTLSFTAAPVPEPATAGMLLVGLLAVVGYAARRRRTASGAGSASIVSQILL